LVFFSSLIEITPFGFTIPGGIVLSAGGYFAFTNKGMLWQIILYGFLGTLTTFIGAYILGAKTGYWVVKKLKQEENAAKAKHLINAHGGVILTTAMLSSALRFWMAYVAGVQKYNFVKFLFYATTASLAWVSMYVAAGFLAGSSRGDIESNLAFLGIFGWVFFIFATILIYLVTKKEFKEFKGETDENSKQR